MFYPIHYNAILYLVCSGSFDLSCACVFFVGSVLMVLILIVPWDFCLSYLLTFHYVSIFDLFGSYIASSRNIIGTAERLQTRRQKIAFAKDKRATTKLRLLSCVC